MYNKGDKIFFRNLGIILEGTVVNVVYVVKCNNAFSGTDSIYTVEEENIIDIDSDAELRMAHDTLVNKINEYKQLCLNKIIPKEEPPGKLPEEPIEELTA